MHVSPYTAAVNESGKMVRFIRLLWKITTKYSMKVSKREINKTRANAL